MKEPEPKFGDLKLPTSEISSSCAACNEPASAFPTGSPRFASIRFESHLTSSFLATILRRSCNVFVTGSFRPQLKRPFHVIFGRYSSGSSSSWRNCRPRRFAVASFACFVPRIRIRCFWPGKDTCAGRAISPSNQSKQASRLRSSP